jgi:hypothetical protein
MVALDRCLSVLSRAHVPVLVVKGAVLAHSLYADFAERPITDVDLRVRPLDFLTCFRALRAEGLRPHWASKQLGAVGFVMGRVPFDIEATIGPPGLCAIGVSEMMSRSRERQLPEGPVVREPELHDHAVLLVVNAFKDKLGPLCPPWAIEDLATIGSRVHVPTFIARIGAAKLHTVAWVVAEWMATRRGSLAWSAIRDALGAPPRRRYARAVLDGMGANPGGLALRLRARIGSDSAWRRIWALGATAVVTGVSGVGALQSERRDG